MKSSSLQELVKKIFADEKTKAEFLKNPETVLSQYTLTETERKAVLSTHAKLGLVTGDSQQLETALTRTSEWWAPAP